MPVSPAYRPDPAFARLGPEFADPVAPADFPKAISRFWNAAAAASVGLDALDAAEREAHFARFQPLPGQGAPLAMRYHGHQFGTYNPELGDGRGFLYAQLGEVGSGRLLDLGTKGSGQTPYSRFGDGRLTLKGGVREVLATAMLEALGVPTSKSFALYETGEDLERGDEPSPTRSAVLTRLSWSHVRFGSFQRHAYFERPDLIAALMGHVAHAYYPELDAQAEPAALAPPLLAAIGERAARMVARWMAAGFVHGVLNTDNMNVNGESFDYGPWRFLPHDAPGFTAAYFDHAGRYAFGRQPQVVFWNLQQLAACLTLVGPDPDALVAALNGFADAYRTALSAAVVARLGVESAGEEADHALVLATFAALKEGAPALRWEPLFFDWFGGVTSERRALEGPRAALYAAPAAQAFRERLAAHAPLRPEALADPVFAHPDPEEMLIDEVEALWTPIAERDDWAPLYAKLERIAASGRAYGLAWRRNPLPPPTFFARPSSIVRERYSMARAAANRKPASEGVPAPTNEAQPTLKSESRVIQGFEDLKDLPLALEDNARKRSVGALNQILADTMMLRDLYKKAHWQVSGATFYSLHLLLDKHYEEQAEAVDTVAERIMALGGISYATPHDVAEVTTLERPPRGREDVPSNLQRLLEAHRKSLAFMREAASEAADYGDDGTNDVIVSDLIRVHEAQVWFIAEHLAATRLLPEGSGGATVTGG